MSGRQAPVHYVDEAAVLRPTDPTVNNDDWPVFVLTDAVVYRPDGVTKANALLMNQDGPFIVRGRFEAEPDDVPHLVKPTTRTAYIQINESKLYSIGYDPDAVVWVSGAAGWFQISPHPSYESIYHAMCEVSELYDFLDKTYKDAAARAKSERKRTEPRDIKEILFEFAVTVGDGATYDETVDKCVRLGASLLTHLDTVEKGDGFPWHTTGFYTWLVKMLKNRERSARSSSRGASEAAQPLPPPPHPAARYPTAQPTIPPQPPSQPHPAPHQLPFRAPPSSEPSQLPLSESPVPSPSQTREHSAGGGETPRDVSAVSAAERQAVLERFLAAVEDVGRETGDPSHTSAGRVHQILNLRYRLKGYSTGKILSVYFAADLKQFLSSPWQTSPYVAYLDTSAAQEFMPASDRFLIGLAAQLVRRTPLVRVQAPAQPQQASSPGPGPSPRPAGKRPVLRPPMTSQKRRFESAFGKDSGSDTEPSVSGEAVMRDRPSGTGAVGRPRKSARSDPDYDQHGPESMQIDKDREVDKGDEDEDDDQSGTSSDYGEESDDPDKKTTTFAVYAQPLIVSTKPTGPNHTWSCPHADCEFFVRNAGSPESSDDEDDGDDGRRTAQETIRDHLRKHEDGMLSQMNLAIAEGSRGQASVNYLLEKIRKLADKKSAEDSSGTGSSRSAAATTASTRLGSLRRFLI